MGGRNRQNTYHGTYYLNGRTIAHPVTGAMNLLQWEAIKHFRALGVKKYNFAGSRVNPEPGSKQAGLAMFKQRFGGTLERGYMWKYSYNPIMRRLGTV
jgi:lipid II:glycine glycyltransferase (peptidoglycan interpeptide bridge formation enzyme)